MADRPLPHLGDLETAVMEHVWRHGAGDVKAVHRAVGVRRRITHNTVQSTMERLFRKGLLAREKVSHAYVYSAALSRVDYGARLVQDIVTTVAGSAAPATVLSAFVDLAERTGDDGLARLEKLIAERRASVKERP
ncbi:MAG: BlaI/MecI/CopY family transcriptional regulator [Anaeromyxobacteraceae bacterium]